MRYKQVFSPFFPVSSGVPQGSKLGPLLFLLSIDDISSVPLHSLLLLFADDLKLYRRISSLSDCAKLQEDLNAISAWAKVNRFSINIAKTHSMTFSRRRQPIDFTYFLDNSPLSRHGLVKDLGVLFDPKLDFSSHIDEIINKAYRSLGFIFRSTLRLQDVDTYKILYSAFVRSKLEYCSSIWCPDTLTTSKRIERIQERFVRLVFFRLNGFYPTFPNQISYKLLLSHIDLDPLSLRRFKHDLFFLHGLLNSSISDSHLLGRIGFQVPFCTLRRCPRPLLSSSLCSSASNLSRMINSVNAHHLRLDIFSPLGTFKQALNDELLLGG